MKLTLQLDAKEILHCIRQYLLDNKADVEESQLDNLTLNVHYADGSSVPGATVNASASWDESIE